MKKQNLKSAILFAVALLLIIGSIVPMMTERAMAGSLVSITFDANASDGHVTSATGPKVRTISTYDRQYQYSWSFPNAYRTGYTFGGWYDNASCTGTRVLPTNWKTSQTKLYAKWTPVTYTITFKPNGGTGGPTSQVKTHGKTLTITSSKPTKTGYDFVGWATSAGGSAQYYANGSYTKNEGATLYAVWKKKKFTITIYTSTGGPNGSAYTYTKEYGASFTIPSTSAPTGYYLAGYGIPTATTDVKYHVGDVYKEDKHLTLYPIFYKKTYPVTYYANGGSNPPAIQIKTHGENLTLASGSPTRTGYTFQGWGTSANATTVAYSPKAVYTGNEGLQLYAIWKINTYSVTYYANGGTGAPAGQIKTYNSNLSLSATIPTRTGYTFQGWGTSAGATTVAYKPGATYTGNAVLNLYAIWKIDQYDVVYNANGGTGAPAAVKKTYGQDLTLSGTIPTRDGYDFKGWATSATGAVAYAAGGTYKNNSAVTLYAVWTKKKYTITIYKNSGGQNGSVYTMTKEHGASVTLPGTTAPRGYVFKGYDPDSTNTTPSYDCSKPNGLVYSDNKNVTLYPIFELLDCRVTFNANGGTNPPDSIAAKFGQEIVLPNVNAEREGYDFGGWSKTKNGSVIGKAGAKYKLEEENQTLYAVWSEKTYTVTLCNGNDHTPKPGSVYTLTKHYFSALELPPCSSVEGFTFTGYRNNSTGETYALGQKYTANANATLFATWDVSVYQIRLHYFDGAEEIVEVVEKTAGEPIVLPSPERINYIFRGWGDNESAVIKYVPGAQYVANASADLYAKWEKLAIVASTDSVSLGINGCSGEDPVRVFLNAEFNGQLYFTVRSQFGATDWLHVELENKEVRISADPNTSGDTLRGATIVVSNGYGVECCIGVIQEGNFIRLTDKDGVIEPSGNQVDFWFDEYGDYNGDESFRAIHVITAACPYTLEVEFKQGEEAFVRTEQVGEHFCFVCDRNTGYEREATLVVKSGAVTRRYRIKQEAATVTITYRFLSPYDNEYREGIVKQKYGQGFTGVNVPLTIESCVSMGGKTVEFAGWRETESLQLIKEGTPLYKNTVCEAYYARIKFDVEFKIPCPYDTKNTDMVVEEHVRELANWASSCNGCDYLAGDKCYYVTYRDFTSITFDCNGSIDGTFLSRDTAGMSEDDLDSAKRLFNSLKEYACPYVIVTLYEFPGSGDREIINPLTSQESFLSMGEVRSLPAMVFGKQTLLGQGSIGTVWKASLGCPLYIGEYVQDAAGEKVFKPYDQQRVGAKYRSHTGYEREIRFIQTAPRVEKKGWDNLLLTRYGIDEKQFYDVRYLGGETSFPNCSIEVKHTITTESDRFVNNTEYRIIYHGSAGISAHGMIGTKMMQYLYLDPASASGAANWLLRMDYWIKKKDANNGIVSVLLKPITESKAFSLIVNSVETSLSFADATNIESFKGKTKDILGEISDIFALVAFVNGSIDEVRNWDLKADYTLTSNLYEAIHRAFDVPLSDDIGTPTKGAFISCANGAKLGRWGDAKYSTVDQDHVSVAFDWNCPVIICELPEDVNENGMVIGGFFR